MPHTHKNKKLKLTKIVATLGPASDKKETIKELIKKGVNVFRFNTKHNTPEWHEKRIQLVQQVADEQGKSISILIDLQGPELRVSTKDKKDITLEKDTEVILSDQFVQGTSIVIPHKAVIESLKKGDTILLEDGAHQLFVKEVFGHFAIIKSQKKVVIKDSKGVNIPSKKFNLPSLIERDLKQLDMASLNKVDYVALSFVRNEKDIKALKTELKKRGVEAGIIAKIENEVAVQNIEKIIDEADGIMVARGDLGVEVPIEQLAYLQKKIIKMARIAHKPVITATEMLESMTTKIRPTRAEATDVANAVYEGSDAVMLSAETASGNYPIEAVSIMSKICRFTEEVRNDIWLEKKAEDTTQLIAKAAVEMLKQEELHVDKFIVFTQTGYTARVVSSYRPQIPVIAVTDSQKTVEKMCLCYACIGVKEQFPDGRVTAPEKIIQKLKEKRLIKEGDNLLIIHGDRWKTPGLTNTISFFTAS